MKLLITGAGGFLGSRLVSFYQNKHTVLGVNHSDLDFTNMNQVIETVHAFSPDAVLHCGAISDVSTCAQNPGLSMDVNVTGACNLAEACAQTGARFIFCSSDQVYFDAETPSADPHKEDEYLNPLPLYGKHKLLAEQLCLQKQPDSVILRLTWMYDTLTQQELDNGRTNFASMLTEALLLGKPLSFSASDHRGITDVKDVVRQMEQVCQLPAGIYNYGSSNPTNMYETAAQILQHFGRPELLHKAESRRFRNLTMNLSKTASCGIFFPDTADGMIAFLEKQEHFFPSRIS